MNAHVRPCRSVFGSAIPRESNGRRTARGFTLIEVSLACSLTVLMAVVLSTTWRLLMPTTASLIARSQLFQEMNVAVASLGRDLGGSLPDYQDADHLPGQKKQGLLLAAASTTDSAGDHLRLCYDGGDLPDGVATWSAPTEDVVVDYYVDAATRTLRRLKILNTASGSSVTSFTVAKNVDSLSVAPYDSEYLQVDLTFSCEVKAVHQLSRRTLTRKCTLLVKKTP
ncbi:MAG: hypothetical protein ABFC54_04630 [Thermoguttaceae bacterium]